MSLTYWSYLQLDKLLNQQQARSDPPEHDEMLFIIAHQVYELWFKLLLHEIDKIKRNFLANELYEAIHTFKRIRTIMKTLVGQLDIVETMTPMSFASFRDRLDTASGFQSSQFRELEFVLGYKRGETLQYYAEDAPRYPELCRRLNEPSVIDYFNTFLEEQGLTLPESVREADPTAPAQPSPQIQDGLYELYRTRPELAILFELMLDFDEGFQEWRYRHIKLVERTIGNKQGTGGSLGVEFLKQSLFMPIFPDLWAIRHRM